MEHLDSFSLIINTVCQTFDISNCLISIIMRKHKFNLNLGKVLCFIACCFGLTFVEEPPDGVFFFFFFLLFFAINWIYMDVYNFCLTIFTYRSQSCCSIRVVNQPYCEGICTPTCGIVALWELFWGIVVNSLATQLDRILAGTSLSAVSMFSSSVCGFSPRTTAKNMLHGLIEDFISGVPKRFHSKGQNLNEIPVHGTNSIYFCMS